MNLKSVQKAICKGAVSEKTDRGAVDQRIVGVFSRFDQVIDNPYGKFSLELVDGVAPPVVDDCDDNDDGVVDFGDVVKFLNSDNDKVEEGVYRSNVLYAIRDAIQCVLNSAEPSGANDQGELSKLLDADRLIWGLRDEFNKVLSFVGTSLDVKNEMAANDGHSKLMDSLGNWLGFVAVRGEIQMEAVVNLTEFLESSGFNKEEMREIFAAKHGQCFLIPDRVLDIFQKMKIAFGDAFKGFLMSDLNFVMNNLDFIINSFAKGDLVLMNVNEGGGPDAVRRFFDKRKGVTAAKPRPKEGGSTPSGLTGTSIPSQSRR